MSSITKTQLFLLAMKNKMYQSLAWSIFSFSLTQSVPKEPLTPFVKEDKWVFMDLEGNEVEISDGNAKEPLFKKREVITYKAGDFIGATKDGTSTFTRVLWHHIVVVYAFGNRIEFKPEGRDISEIEKIVSAGLIDGVDADDTVPEGKFNVRQYLLYTEALGSILTGLAQLFTPATTEKSLITDPKIKEVKKKRLEENKDRLHDPAVIASIKNELIGMDKQWVKGDDAEDFLLSKKSYDQVRVKTMIMHGEESAFSDGTQVTLIPTSLDEGLNLNHMPEYSNAIRQGSYNRGSETALGGELAQFLIRIFQNHMVTETEDCGTKQGLVRELPVNGADFYVGLNVVENGKVVTLTEDNISSYAGKTVMLRSPQYCREAGNGYCKACIGAVNAKYPEALGGQALDIGSTILYIFMKKAHGSALKTVPWNIESDLY